MTTENTNDVVVLTDHPGSNLKRKKTEPGKPRFMELQPNSMKEKTCLYTQALPAPTFVICTGFISKGPSPKSLQVSWSITTALFGTRQTALGQPKPQACLALL